MTLDMLTEDLNAVQVMLWFLYFGEYPYLEDDRQDGNPGDLHFSLHAKAYALGKKFELLALASLAIKHFAIAAKVHWNKWHFLECIPFIYGAPVEPDGAFRYLVTSIVKSHLGKLIIHERHWICYQEYIERYPLFAQDIFCSFSTLYAEPSVAQESWHTITLTPTVLFENARTTGKIRAERTGCEHFYSLEGESVYSDADDVLYDAALLRIKPRKCRNRFIRMQVLRTHTTPLPSSVTWHLRVWSGPVGETGVVQTFEGAAPPLYTRGIAVKKFEMKFWLETGLDWSRRFDSPIMSKYTFIGSNYEGINSTTVKKRL